MRKQTRFKFNAYLTRVAELNGVEAGDMNKKFTIEPSVSQKLMTRVQESSAFLTRINIVPVPEMKGEKIGISVSGSIASTTDTASGDERETADFSALDSTGYECGQVNYDFHIRYNTLDLWARYQDFQTRLRDAIVKRQALDRIMIGFNGTHRAKTSNRVTSPMLQDVATGWLQKYRNDAPARVMSSVKDNAGNEISAKVRIGEGGDYMNLDALVMDVTNTLIAPWYQEDPELVVICGRQLLADKYFPLINKEQDNSEQLAADVIISQKRIGNLPAIRVPYFPPDALFITRPDNLSIYWLEGSHRRMLDEVAKRDRIENYESIQEDYVIEDYAAGCLVENIEMLPPPKKKDDDSDTTRTATTQGLQASDLETLAASVARGLLKAQREEALKGGEELPPEESTSPASDDAESAEKPAAAEETKAPKAGK